MSICKNFKVTLYKKKLCGRMFLISLKDMIRYVVKLIKTGGYCIDERKVCSVCRNLYPWKQYWNSFV